MQFSYQPITLENAYGLQPIKTVGFPFAITTFIPPIINPSCPWDRAFAGDYLRQISNAGILGLVAQATGYTKKQTGILARFLIEQTQTTTGLDLRLVGFSDLSTKFRQGFEGDITQLDQFKAPNLEEALRSLHREHIAD